MKKIVVSTIQQTLLTTIIHGGTSPQRLVRRATIILAGYDSSNQSKIAFKENTERNTVHLWLKRWQNAIPLLNDLEAEHTAGRLSLPLYQHAISDILTDAPRPGAPVTFTEEEKRKIITLASEKPEKADIPVTHWTYSLIAKAVKDKGIVKTISRSRVGVFLKESRFKAASE